MKLMHYWILLGWTWRKFSTANIRKIVNSLVGATNPQSALSVSVPDFFWPNLSLHSHNIDPRLSSPLKILTMTQLPFLPFSAITSFMRMRDLSCVVLHGDSLRALMHSRPRQNSWRVVRRQARSCWMGADGRREGRFPPSYKIGSYQAPSLSIYTQHCILILHSLTGSLHSSLQPSTCTGFLIGSLALVDRYRPRVCLVTQALLASCAHPSSFSRPPAASQHEFQLRYRARHEASK